MPHNSPTDRTLTPLSFPFLTSNPHTMHSRIQLLLLALPLAFAPASISANAQDEEPATPLHLAMEGLGSGMRSLRKQMGDGGDVAQALETVRAMQEHATAAFGHPPTAPEGSDEKATAVWNLEFRRGVLQVALGLLDVEQALIEGRTDDARAGYAALNKLKSAGHDKFQLDEE